jgi:hypothetical protein
MSRAARCRNKSFSGLKVEHLESRCVPSASSSLDFGAGLDGEALLSDPLFATLEGHQNAKALLAAVAGMNATATAPAGNAATPSTGTQTATTSGATTPFEHPAGSPATVVPFSSYTATLTVNTTADETSKDSTLSLREALRLIEGTLKTSALSSAELAQISGTVTGAKTGTYLINFAPGLSGVINLTGALPQIQATTAIEGPGAASLAINGNYASQLTSVKAGVSTTITGLTLENGSAKKGGAIYNLGALTLAGCTFTGNNAYKGGGIYETTGGSLNVIDCTFANNSGTNGCAIFSLSTKQDPVSITGSTFTDNGIGSSNGGAIMEVNNHMTITGTNFTGNSSQTASALISLSGSLSMQGCTFANNTGTSMTVGTLLETSLSITGCTFTNNTSTYGLGAFYEGASQNASISGCTFAGNRSFGHYGRGAALTASDSLSIANCTFTDNTTSGKGGAIYWRGSGTSQLSVTGSVITGNRAGVQGGGIETYSSSATAIAYLTNDTITGNSGLSGTGSGGGIANDHCRLTITGCTVSGNTAQYGAGIFNQGKYLLEVVASTVSGNTATGVGGGIDDVLGFMILINTTVADNVATRLGGGVYEETLAGFTSHFFDTTIAFNQAGGNANPGAGINSQTLTSLYLYNTIVAGNTIVGGATANDIAGKVNTKSANNLIGDSGSAGGLSNGTKGNIIGVASPGLSSLGFHGGPTQTIMLLPGSPALNAGNNSLLPVGLTTDQRGLPRIANGTVDIGAVEVQPAGTATQFVIEGPGITSSGVGFDFTVKAEDDFGNIITGYTGTVSFSSSDPSAVLPNSFAFTAADAGVHTFSAILSTSGPQSITVTDPTNHLVGVQEMKVVAGGVFFLDGNHQLWLDENGKFTNTGGFATRIAGTLDANDNPECYFTDGSNEIWRWDNGVFTNLGVFGTRIAAGQGTVAFTDGNNEIWIYSDATGKANVAGVFGTRLVGGFNASGQSQFVFTDGSNQVWTLTSAGVATNTHAFGTRITEGTDAQGNFQVWFTDGNNEIWRIDNGSAFATGGFALSMSGAANGVFFQDGINEIFFLSTGGAGLNTGAFGTIISSAPSLGGVFLLDGKNEIFLSAAGIGTATGAFALPGFLSAF